MGVPLHRPARRPPIAVGRFRDRPVHPAAARVGWRNDANSRRMAGRQDGRTLPARSGRRASSRHRALPVRRRAGHSDPFVHARHPLYVGGRPDRPSIARPNLRSIADRGLRRNRTGSLGTIAERPRVRYLADERSAEDSRPSDHHDQHGHRIRRAAAPDVLAADTRRGARDAPRLGRRAALHEGRSRAGRERHAIQLRTGAPDGRGDRRHARHPRLRTRALRTEAVRRGVGSAASGNPPHGIHRGRRPSGARNPDCGPPPGHSLRHRA